MLNSMLMEKNLLPTAPDLANTVNKKLTQSNRDDVIANGHNSKVITMEKLKTKHDDLWEEDEDDDDDDDEIDNIHQKQQPVKLPQPVKNLPTVNNNHLHQSNSQLNVLGEKSR